MSHSQDLQEAFNEVKKIELSTKDYDTIINLICDFGNKCIDRTTKESIKIINQNYGA